MNDKIRIAIIGCGEFAKEFIPIFKAHPYVEKIFVCDKIKEKALEYQKKFDVEVIDTFEDALNRKDVNAIAIFVQRHLHGPFAIKALNAGKNVYSAVPMASEVSHCKEIIDVVKRTGLTYMMGETCVYYPCSIYCKKEHAKGTFGKFVYAESQYIHDIEHFGPNAENNPELAVPPLYYSTHSLGMVLNALDTHVTKVSALGTIDHVDGGIYRKGNNIWDNEFSNEFSFMQLANGGIVRINECRRMGYKAPSSFISSFYGTDGAYQYNNAQHLVTTKTKQGVNLKDVSEEVSSYQMNEHRSDIDFKERVANHAWAWDSYSPVQQDEYERLPNELKSLSQNGHMASHQFLIDDFCQATYKGEMPKVNAWVAARFTIPGLIAHESAKQGGVMLDVPDFGDAPKKV